MQQKTTTWQKIHFYVAAMSLGLFFGYGSLKATDEQDFSHSRAGVVLLKKYTEGDWAIHFGEKTGTTQEWKSINFPAGQYDSKDRNNLENTAIREMIEETGGKKYSPLFSVTSDSFYKTWSAFNSGKEVPPYLDHRNQNGHIRLYFLDVTPMMSVDQGSLASAVQSAIRDPHSPHDCKEVSNYWAVPMKDVYAAAQTVNVTRKNNAENRRVKSRGTQQKLQMEGYYMAALSGKVHEFRKILKDITGQDPQLENVVSMSYIPELKPSSIPFSSTTATTTTTATSTTQPVLMDSYLGESESVIREAIRNLESCSDNALFRGEIDALKSFLPKTSATQFVSTSTKTSVTLQTELELQPTPVYAAPTPVVCTNAPVLPVVILSPVEQQIADLKALPMTRNIRLQIERLEQQLQLSAK